MQIRIKSDPHIPQDFLQEKHGFGDPGSDLVFYDENSVKTKTKFFSNYGKILSQARVVEKKKNWH